MRSSWACPTLVRDDWKEQLTRAYVYWAPHPWLALTAEYLYERFERDSDFAKPARRPTSRGRTGCRCRIGLFHPSGFTRPAPGDLRRPGRGLRTRAAPSRRDDQFWVLDASIGYRLPRRWGLITLEGRNLLDEHFRFQDTDPPIRPSSPSG